MPLDPIEITGGLAIGEGLGGAIADTVEPRLQNFKNDQWSKHQDVPLDAAAAAEVAAEDVAQYGAMAAEASFTGYDATRFANLYGVTLNAPGMGELLNALRRGTINPGNFSHGLRKARLEPMWDDALADLANVKLTPAQLALGIVRSVVDDPGLLVVSLDTSGSTIPKYPVWGGNVLEEAAAGGIDEGRLRVLVGEVGLPMSPIQAAQAVYRGIVNRAAYNLAILEGDVRPEYADAIFEVSRQILTAGEYAELELRGFLTAEQRRTRTAMHGMTQADSDLLYDLLGRSVNVHQILIGERRGGTYNGSAADIPDAYLHSLQRGNLRPEYYNLAYAGRETYPSAFVIRGLLTAGAITQARGHELFLGLGWPADVAESASATFAGGGGTTGDKHVAKAQTQLWTRAHSSYVAGEADDAAVTPALTAAGVAGTAIPEVIALWQAERELVRKQLTATQLRKAWSRGVVNPATGAAWTQDEAIARLEAMGYSAADALTFMEEA